MSQSPPNNMNSYMKTSSILNKNQLSESESRKKRRMQGGGVLKTQRDYNEQSLNYSQTNRHMYNNTDSAERGPVLTNEGNGFYSAQK